MEIDPRSHVPIYLQIVDAIRAAIAARAYRPREALPSLRALAIEIKVNPNTIQRAYDELERAGLVYSQRGKGLFVTDEGTQVAQEHARRNIRRRIDDTLHEAGRAGMKVDQVREIFELAAASFASTEGQKA